MIFICLNPNSLFIYGENDQDQFVMQEAADSDTREQLGESDDKASYLDRPTIIFCNPNAGYYEFLFYNVRNNNSTEHHLYLLHERATAILRG